MPKLWRQILSFQTDFFKIYMPPPGYQDDVIKWKHFPRYWPFVRGIHRSPVNSPHKGQWRGASMFSLICVWINGWVNNGEAGDLRRYRTHYDVTVMQRVKACFWCWGTVGLFQKNKVNTLLMPWPLVSPGKPKHPPFIQRNRKCVRLPVHGWHFEC